MVVRDTCRAVGFVGIGLASTLGALATLAGHPHDGGRTAFGAGSVIIAVICVLASRRGVRVTQSGVRLQYLVRSRYVRWEDLVCFQVAEVRSPLGERLAKPSAVLRNGEPLPLPGADRFAIFTQDAHRSRFPVLERLEEERHRLQ